MSIDILLIMLNIFDKSSFEKVAGKNKNKNIRLKLSKAKIYPYALEHSHKKRK